MKVAITGKGGVGKTTLASTLARLYAQEGRCVLAADVRSECHYSDLQNAKTCGRKDGGQCG